MASLDDKLIINAALTGMVPTKADNPHLPVSPEEIAADVYRCYNAGASIVHLHARDRDGTPTYRIERYRTILSKIRETCPDDLIVCLTTSGRLFNTFDKRSQVLDLEEPLKPDMASLTLARCNGWASHTWSRDNWKKPKTCFVRRCAKTPSSER